MHKKELSACRDHIMVETESRATGLICPPPSVFQQNRQSLCNVDELTMVINCSYDTIEMLRVEHQTCETVIETL